MDKNSDQTTGKRQPELLENVRLLKNATVRMEVDGKVVYFDPYSIDEPAGDADVIFITHTHYDHFSLEDIRKLVKEDTALVITVDGEADAAKAGISNIKIIAPDEASSVAGIEFRTVPAYNPKKRFHPKEKGWVGYIISAGDAKYYIAGDTDYIPEMKDIKADVVFLPVGGIYTMNSTEAAQAANTINPTIAVPIHYADVVGIVQDAQDFIQGLNPSIIGVLLK